MSGVREHVHRPDFDQPVRTAGGEHGEVTGLGSRIAAYVHDLPRPGSEQHFDDRRVYPGPGRVEYHHVRRGSLGGHELRSEDVLHVPGE